jgi:hypothetical protein
MTKFRFEVFCESGNLIYMGVNSLMATQIELLGYTVKRYWDNELVGSV